MQRFILTIKILGGLLLIWYGLTGWALEGSVFFVALVLLGLFEFLGAITQRLTGKMTFGTYRKIFFVLLLGAVTGALLFDLPAIYLFKVWTYHGGIPNPLANIPLYGIEALGWGAFLIIFYDAYTLVHLAFDFKFHSIGFSSRNRSVIDHLFSFLGVVGICLFFVSVGLALAGQTASAWPPTIGGFGVWFMLEDIEYKRSHRTLLLSTARGHLAPIVSIVLVSVTLGFIFEYFNIIAPVQLWTYASFPFSNLTIAGVPIFLLVSWSWMLIIFLSIYSIFYKKEPLWK